MAECGLRKRRDPTLRRLWVDAHLGSLAAHMYAVLPELVRSALCELERVDRLQARLVAAALDPRSGPELVEELRELPRRRVDHLHVALLRLAEIAHADQRLGEAVDRRERRAQVVRGKRHETREAGIGSSHRAAGH